MRYRVFQMCRFSRYAVSGGTQCFKFNVHGEGYCLSFVIRNMIVA